MKIAIIGAGINGLYLAWKLSQKGHKVVVFEKKSKIGNDICSGLFSERIIHFIPESKKLIKKKVDFCYINFPKKTIRLNFSKSFFLISHYQLDNLVSDLAKKSGVKIILENKINNISEFNSKFDRIIGCDGASSTVRKSLNLANPVFFQGILTRIKNSEFSEKIETWPCENK